MANVVKFPTPEERQAHLSGECKCMNCQHEWAGCMPVGVVDGLECPECGSFKGVSKYQCIRAGAHWQCGCGNEFFCLTPAGLYCPNCGVEVDG